MTASVQTRGFEELQRTFANLPRATQTKALRPGLRAGAKVLQKTIIGKIKSGVQDESTGIAAKNISIYSLRVTKSGQIRYAVMVRRGAVNNQKKGKDGKPVRIGLYMSVREYGKEGQPPKPVFRSSAREDVGDVLSATRIEVTKRMGDAVKAART